MWNIQDQPWCNLHTLCINRLPARAGFVPYATAQDAWLDGDNGRVQLLNGPWRFRWLPSPLLVDEALIREPAETYDVIQVPRSWQFAGYGKMLYTDEAYPFPIDPPYIPAENETGVYKRLISLDLSEGLRLFLRFEGVESAFSLYLNGQFVGYSQGSRMPSEFEITSFACNGDNALCVVVYQYCSGTYLEDQDMWWLGGIIRDVALIKRPQSHLEDLVLNADYDPKTCTGTLTCAYQGDGELFLSLYSPSGELLINHASSKETITLPNALSWNAEEPHLYTLIASYEKAGETLEATRQRIGFRRIEIKDGTLLLNGQRIMMRGVNRHEFHPENGRAVSSAQTLAELKLIKDAGMNAVRTSHYPNIPAFYDYCDALGLYVIDECDLETHGFEIEGNPTRLAEDPAWEKAYVERAERMVKRDRNHACILLWSLGNESWYGRNFKAMYDYIKALEPTRPVHYEPDRRCQSCDVSSTMYTPIGGLYELDTNQNPKRPHILCEFGHAMGNGPGSLKEYIDVLENAGRIQGYFVWELKDHGVLTKDADGKTYYRYGGEFGEDYTTGNFCMDGLLFADGSPSPGFWEYKALIAPVHMLGFDLKSRCLQIKNRFDFLNLKGIPLTAAILRDGETAHTQTLTLHDIPPHAQGCVSLFEALDLEQLDNALWTLDLQTPYGEKHFVLREYAPQPKAAAGEISIVWASHRLHLSGANFSAAISLIDGRLEDYQANGQTLVTKGPGLNFFRAYIDNDKKHLSAWQAQHLHTMAMTVHSAKADMQKGRCVVVLDATYAPNARNWRCHVQIQYTIGANGQMQVSYQGRFKGDPGSEMPRELPKIGTVSIMPKDLDHVLYCGMGPGESYCDSHGAAYKGLFRAAASALSVAYEKPQDNGNRTGVDFVAVTNRQGKGVSYAALSPADFSLRDQSDKALHRAAHPCFIPHEDRQYLYFDKLNSGLGSGSCGPNHLPQHTAFTDAFSFSFAITPIADGNALAASRRGLDFLKALQEDENEL